MSLTCADLQIETGDVHSGMYPAALEVGKKHSGNPN